MDNKNSIETKLPHSTLILILGFLSCIIFGVLTGIPAIILGHKALGKYKKEPLKYNIKDKRQALSGLLLGYTGTVLTAVLILKLIS